MSMTDPIADMLTRIRNALLRRHESVEIPYSKIKEAIARVLVEEGYLLECAVTEGSRGRLLLLKPKYYQGDAVIRRLERRSKPSRRLYCSRDAIPLVEGGLGIAVLSTPQGVMTDRAARAAGVGGEVICYVT